ncbi:unnamed protein product, partial [Adineta steineri]
MVSDRTKILASSAQQRIYMHENLYFSASDFSVYNYVIPLIIKRGSVSIEHIRFSLVSVIQQHTVLRTAIRFNLIRNEIEQNILPLTEDIYSFQHSRGVSTLEQLDYLLTNESIGKYFDVENGKVLRCHVVQRSAENHDDSLHEGDLIIFVIHHIAFDLSSYKPFLKAFERACWVTEYQPSLLTMPQYVDFALHEQALLTDTSPESKMNKARRFWTNFMHGYDWDKIRYLVPDGRQTDRLHSGRGYTTAFTIDQDVVDAMMLFASTNNVTMFSVYLTCYYAFLFKLAHHSNDLCVVSSTANRSEKEIQDTIGMFVNLVLYRVKTELNNTFEHLVKQVQPLSKEILVHSSLPYQQIIESQGKRENNVLPSAFFQYEPLKLAVTQKNSIELTLSEGSILSGYYDRDLNHLSSISLFDMSLTVIHDHHTPSTECFLNCSADIFKQQDDVDLLSKRFHHILTQLFSIPMLQESIHKLTILLSTEQISLLDPSTCTIPKSSSIDQKLSMSEASMFWLDTLHDCKLDQSLSLPFDRYRLVNEHRTSHTISISFDFGQHLSHHLLTHASSNNISLEHLIFAIYFIFLFKLTNGQTDICVAMNINDQYRNELKSVIGLAENVIPLRCQLDPHWCFHQLLEHVREITTKSMKYSYFPLQRILDQYSHVSKHAFLDTSLEFISYKSNNDNNTIMMGDSQLVPATFPLNINDDEILSTSDFSLSFHHDVNMNQLSCTINATLDLYNQETVEKISQRFHLMLHKLCTSMIDNQINKPIYELSLILSNERYLMQSLNNTQISFSSSLTCIHHEFVYQVMKHPQKLAVELDEQSMTYSELLYYVHVLSLTLLNEYFITPGEVVIGIMAIEMAGGVYCPLSPRDPQHRLHALAQQTQSRLVFIHHLTTKKFEHDIVAVDIDAILTVYNMERNIDIDRLSSIRVTLDDLAYIIFTSGSTGIPKAVQVRHNNFTEFMRSLNYSDVVNKKDTILQIARCSYDAHAQDIIGTFMTGSSLIMLHPRGIMDFDYLTSVFKEKNITCITTVPTIIHNFFTYLQQQNHHNVTQYLRSVCSADQFSQSVLINQEGELFVGGVGVFAGYLGRDDLSAKTLVEIDDEIFYRTGDLVRMDNNGLIHYQGRKDHQIKLHGQRIELGEIERCLLTITSISACVVMKWNDDYLVAYVQSSIHMSEQQLRQHCQSHLPPHMIPSIFILLEKLPLNQNGKIDRKLLPSPHFSSTHLTNSIELLLPTNDIEVSIHHIWCEIFNQNQISIDTNIFTIGGHSLLMMQLFHRYKIEFHLEQKQSSLSISTLFQHPTITHHAQLIQQSINTIHTLDNSPWSSLHLMQARASFAQERIYLDEQVRFSSKKTTMNNMYVIPLLYRISSMNDHVSITRLYHALRTVITKHNILRTALYFDTNSNIIQHCLEAHIILNDDMKSYGLTIVNIRNDDHRHMNEIIEEILNQADLFDLSKGFVIRCHILRHHDQSQDGIPYDVDDLLTRNDHILISVHHAMFDGASMSIFLRDLSLAYQSDDSLSVVGNKLNYIDYSVHEHIMDMSLAREFWHSQLEGYDMECLLSLPFDRQRSSTNQQRSGVASIAEINFDNELCTSFLNYASSHHLTLFQLGLATFYIFLFKLTHSQTDLCISSINANRYRNELQNLIGMFVSTVPYRLEIDSSWSFDELVTHVREKCLLILEHSHYPLQHILDDNRLDRSNVSFLETMLEFISLSKDVEHLCLNDANLERKPLDQSAEVAKFDFSLSFVYNPLSNNRGLSCSFICSNDLFGKSTISQIAQRFQHMFKQLFQAQSSNIPLINGSSSINSFSLILPEEAEEMKFVMFYRLENVLNEAPASFAQARIWLDERIRFDPDKPQIAIYNMPFVYCLQSGHTLSSKQLFHALHLTVDKHLSLHTSLHFDIQNNLLMQRVINPENKNNTFSIMETTYETDEQLNEMLHDEKRNPHLFDLAQGLVFRCHIIYYKQISSNHLLSDKDLIIFNFHHAQFDFPSMEVFHHDLNQAYTTSQLLCDDNTNLRYLDYAVIEQKVSMTGASMFWLDALHECKLDHPLSLPFDRYRLAKEHRTGRGTSISFDFGLDLSHDFLIDASSNSVSLEYLALATYYVFLFKLTNEQRDLCIGMNTHGRYRNELRSIIGMFVNAIPLRCQLDPYLSFHKITKHVQDNMINCMKYSYFPLQRILNQHPNISNPVFLDTSFDFLSSTTKDEETEIIIGDSRLSLIPYSTKISEDEIMSKFDFILSFQHDLNLNEFSCTIDASLDLFNVETVCIIAQRLQTMLHQQFISFDCTTNKPIYELSLVLSDERYLMQSLNNTQVSFSSPGTCIHHEFIYQAMKHPQKLAVELDEQSLTYCELLYYIQVLSLTLLNEYHVLPGEVVCQCVERSLSMVIGIMGIEMAGGVYCPLSPRDPEYRLHALIQQTQSRLVLVHNLTKTKFDHDIISLDLDSVSDVNNMDSDIDNSCLSKVMVEGEEIAYIIFTSGSTGIPKAVQVRHKNFIDCINSLAYINSFNKDDTVVQMTRCSFDIHVQEILGTLLIGGTLIMLHPGGEPFSAPFIGLIMKIGITNCILWNLYGPAEATIGSTLHCVNVANDTQKIPIGRPFYNYRCMIMNQYLQSSVASQEGELFVGGVGVFAGYFGRDDLTAKALVEIDGELFYRTGDLVKMDPVGLLYFTGRNDYQIKLRGQRIELGEIERCLLNKSISACVVIKGSDDYLVAYVQSSDVDEKQLRQHCQSHLPPHMIPSFFIILDKLPLNANGKMTLNIDTTKISISEFFQHTTIADHARLIHQSIDDPETYQKLLSAVHNTQETSLRKRACSISKENIIFVVDELSRYEPFPVTDIQLAYLVGREGVIDLGHVSAFVYREYDFPSTFNIERFERALNYLIQRHEALRLIFPSHTEQKILKIVPYYTISILNLEDVEYSQRHLIERREQLSHQIRPANQWPLFDFQITRFISDDGYNIRLHFGIDILILDVWSTNLVLHELNQLYYNMNDNLVELKLSYRDYILAEQKWKHTTIYSNDRRYWINRLKSFPLGPNLPLRCLPNEIHVQRHSNAATAFDLSLWQKLRQRITDHGLTPAGFLASIYALVLGKWSENKHFALNLPIFNRLPIHPQVNQIVGEFSAIIPLEINLDKIITYYEFLHTVQKQLWNDLEHVSYDGVAFIRDLMQVHQTREILLPYVLTCAIDVEDIREKNVEQNIFFDKKSVYVISQTPQVFIDHIIGEIDGCLLINWTYVDNLLRKEMLNHMHDTFVDLLVKFASCDGIWQKPIFISLPSEQQQRRLDFNQTQWQSNVQDKLLHSLVIKQAEITPNALAIISSQVNLTYKQLMNRVYSLAHHLQQQQQIYSNQLVAILMKKGWEQIVACLTILVSGGAYLPLDIDSPYDRLCSLIEETNVTILLTQSHCKHRFPHLTTVSVDTFTTDDNYSTPFPIKQQSSTDLAYIIYTSGSTGKPKGVMISHQAVVNTILDMNSRLEISTNDRIFALSHLNFDLSVYDIFGMLFAGGTIVIPNHEHYKNPEHWYDMTIQHQVTIWNSVPVLMQMFVEYLKHTNNNHNQLRHILLSGDWIPLSLPESIQTTFGEQVTITSLGGATEASIWSIAYTPPKEIPKEWKSIPYGIPLRNQEYYVYDIHLDDCPEWVIGELYIGGEGLANGYWNDQEKTQSSFITHPLTNKRLYRTGDYGRFLPNGYIEFMGRKDFQVKVHGHRIELGEIEHHLQQHPDIHQAIVNIDDKSQHLIGYIMPEKHIIHNKEYNSTEILITDPIERINFKLVRHSVRHEKKVEKSFALTKPKVTETLINTYYMRKSYRKFTNETIERSTIEKLLKNCHNSNNNEKISLSHINFDILSQLLAVLTPIGISDQPLPKYRYASIDDLYPVQVYVELPTSLDNISPGVYYHNPDEHTLELTSTPINNEMINIRLHLVGRSSAIAPLYGQRLGSQFCMLETGYVMGLLEKEGSRLGLTFSKNADNESITSDTLNIDEKDTHCCFKISSSEQNISNNVQNGNYQCIIYLKSVNNNKDQWFTYNKEYDIVTSLNVETETTQEEMPLFFDDDDDVKIIFHDCQGAIFFIGRSEDTMNIGKLSHLLMDHCLEMNIGVCPIGTRTSFPKKINDVLDTILMHEELNGSNILHTLLIGKISNKQKSECTTSKVKSMPNWSETLRIYLRETLPMYMVPSHFISVSSFPLSPNGKIDRKALPEISLSVLQQEDTYNAPNTELEKTIANIWQEVLYTNRLTIHHDDPAINVSGIDRQTSFLISTTASFFSVGGNSLLLVKIYQRYQSKFNFESEVLSIRSFFDYNTIVEHAKLLETIIINGTQLEQWHTLNINEGIASYAQERIFLDERVRFSDQIAIYNALIIQRVTKGSLSVNRLLQALRYVISKHKILRTSLVFNDEDSILKQFITDKHLTFTLAVDQTFKNEIDLHNIISQMNTDPTLFDLPSGRVFYCQILRQQMVSDKNNDKEIIANSDVLVIGFHHVAIDLSTFPIFFNDLCNTYNSNMTWLDDEQSLQYIDYSVHERLIDVISSRKFWRSELNGYNHKCRLSLPVDRHCIYTDQRSGYASIAHISFDNEISTSFLDYASSHQVTLFQLGLATLYAFLFKFTYRQNDLCISCHNANRYRIELQNMIGMFVSTLPYRIQLDPQCSFDELVTYVQEKCLSILEHSHYPLQRILHDFHLNQSTVPFLQTLFDFFNVSAVDNQFTFDDANLQPVTLKQFSETAKFDFNLKFVYNPISDDNILSCHFICSRDLFEDTTVTKMIQRFQYLFEQLFSMNCNVNQTDFVVSPIAKLTLILPDEMNEMQYVAFYRQSNVTNE